MKAGGSLHLRDARKPEDSLEQGELVRMKGDALGQLKEPCPEHGVKKIQFVKDFLLLLQRCCQKQLNA